MDSTFQKNVLEIPAELHGQRLDKALAVLLSPMTRSRVQQLLASGDIICSDAPFHSPSQKVKAEQIYQVRIPDLEDADPVPQDIPLDIVYEDEHLLVINKQAGLVVHPAPGAYDGTLVNALLYHCGESLSGINGVKRPGIVHRLDKDTSGLMVIAKSDIAHQGLATQFADRTLSRRYLALVWGIPDSTGEIIAPIGRNRGDRKKMIVTNANSKEAITSYRMVETFLISKSLHQCVSLVECKLLTGRTHQIRVHMTHRGHSVVGDQTYGRHPKALAEKLDFLKEFPRQVLHAFQLHFVHPVSNDFMTFTGELPDDISQLLGRLREMV